MRGNMLKNMFIREIFSIVVLKSLVLRERERERAHKRWLIALYWVDLSREHLPVGAEFCQSTHL